MMYITLGILISALELGNSGTSVMPVLKIGQGPRAAALGESYLSIADDATALYWNPAGLGQLVRNHVALSHQQWFSDTKDELLHAAFPMGPGALGASLLYSGEPGIERWDAGNEPLDTFSTWNACAAIGFGAHIVKDYFVGGAVTGYYQDLRTTAGYGGAASIGGLARPLPFLKVAAALRNAGIGMGYGSGIEQLPADLGLGASFYLQQFASRLPDIRTTVDVSVPLDNAICARIGVEYCPLPALAVRAGYRTGPADLSTLGFLSGLCAGVGVKVSGLSVDYSITPYGKLGIAHRIGLSGAFLRRGSGSVRVHVIDAKTMMSLPANVDFSGTRDLAAHTDRDGDYLLRDLLAGTLVIQTSTEGYAPRTDTMRVLGDREQSAIIALHRYTYGGFSGTIYDASTRKPVGGKVSYRGVTRGTVDADAQLGTFAVRSMPEGDYVLTVAGPTPDYRPQVCTLAVSPAGMTRRDFYLTRSLKTIVLEGINFQTGKADILPQFEPALRRSAEILKKNPSMTVEIAGHTDPREISTTQYPSNWELSEARANAVRDWLIQNAGISADRLVAHGYAETQPIAPNDTEEGMAKNRRVEFRVTGQ